MEQTELCRAVGVLTVVGKGFRLPQVSRSEEEVVPLCFDRREWFCDFWDYRRSSGLSLCRLRPCCCRQKRLPLIHRSFWPPPELLPGPVWNRSCLIVISCCYGYSKSGWELRL
ncbi:uncharacterized protein LOC107612205 [Arachis ipaensis]|uniref:uncharacterized protein LOC107612205 n=1 Tax=Arachis ipaensis TaxID=130454 RepID=UPI0007AF3354|nr:uncharacterized protein LOC107612205 [Arachis ipaensis]